MKVVTVLAYDFDCLPGHVRISKRDEGFNLRVAVSRAVQAVLSDEQLKHKQIGDFKMSVVVVKD